MSCPTTVFKTAAFDHSAIHPVYFPNSKYGVSPNAFRMTVLELTLDLCTCTNSYKQHTAYIHLLIASANGSYQSAAFDHSAIHPVYFPNSKYGVSPNAFRMTVLELTLDLCTCTNSYKQHTAYIHLLIASANGSYQSAAFDHSGLHHPVFLLHYPVFLLLNYTRLLVNRQCYLK